MFKITKENGSETIQSQVPFNLEKIPESFAFVVVSKKGLPFSTLAKNFKAPEYYFEKEALNYRVWQCDEVINKITSSQIKNPQKIIAIGHSEGADVVAKLGTVNPKITHIGFWSGGGNTQYYDFALFIWRQVTEGKIDAQIAIAQLDSLFSQISEIETDSNSISKLWKGSTYSRWSHFSEASIENLLKIDIPIFVAFGAEDQSVPVESALIIPIEFKRLRKENLTFRLYPGYDHSFNNVSGKKGARPEPHWMDVFEALMDWSEKH